MFVNSPCHSNNRPAPPTLLLVQDKQQPLECLERALIERYHVVKAANDGEALRILAREAIQLVIGDLTTPAIDVFGLCKAIKSNFKLSHIPVLLLTAKNMTLSKIEALEIGADACIERPVSIRYLEAQITSLLTNRNLLRSYFAHFPQVYIKTIAHSWTDARFSAALRDAIEANMENEALDIDLLAKTMNVSRATLYRRIRAITSLTPFGFINHIRLAQAAALLAQGDHKIYEVALLVGYSSQSNFGRHFSRHYHMTPTEYRQTRLAERKTA